VNAGKVVFDPQALAFDAAGVRFSDLAPLLDGAVVPCEAPQVSSRLGTWTIRWQSRRGPGTAFVLRIESLPGSDDLRLDLAMEGAGASTAIDSLGLRMGRVDDVLRYLRNGYTSWDGSYFVEIESARGQKNIDARCLSGYAVTALVGRDVATAAIGFLRHDRYQSRLRFEFASGPFSVDLETLIDRVPSEGEIRAEPLVLLAGSSVEDTLRRWSRHVAGASPLPPRKRTRRISGWCSWYSLYSSISEPVLLEHLQAAARFRDRHQAPLEVFQIDDGFTPEMGDWLDVKPSFPRGMAPLLADIRAAGFVPGLWIAPFMIGNRSRLYAEHPDWVVRERASGRPLAPMKFYGEFRWHKRSEEYYCLDITHPKAEEHIREVFRTWAKDWGCGYFKTDFMYFGAEYGPDQAQWHIPGLSRMAIWMLMARLIREEIGEALWLGCGGPIWTPIGLVDAVRIGRDIGVSWRGHYSAESLLRDQAARNFANGVLWQADPDCILLRDRFHDLTDDEVHALAVFGGLAGGVLMTSDQLDEVPEHRRAMFAEFARASAPQSCDFPMFGTNPGGDPVLIQRVTRVDGSVLINVFNTGDSTAERLIPWELTACRAGSRVTPLGTSSRYAPAAAGIQVAVSPHAACLLLISGRT
jgi:hypothetical protein